MSPVLDAAANDRTHTHRAVTRVHRQFPAHEKTGPDRRERDGTGFRSMLAMDLEKRTEENEHLSR